MKKLITFFSTLVLLFFVTSSSLHAAEKVSNFSLRATINEDGSVRMVETIDYDFGYSEHHGIYRTIPLSKKNEDGKDYIIDLELVSITDEKGTIYSYTDSSTKKEAEFKIGNANVTVTGAHTYVLTYVLKGAISYFEDHDELYWNVTGFDWEVPFESVNATVVLPDGTVSENVYLKCFTGVSGSTAQNCEAQKVGTSYKFATTRSLSSGENLSLVLGFPKNTVATLLPAEDKLTAGEVVGIVVGFLAVFGLYLILPLILLVVWWEKGRDPKVQPGPRAWFDVPKHDNRKEMTPAEVGLIIDEKIDARDVSATIVWLAINGYLIIEKMEKPKGILGVGKKDEFKFLKTKKESLNELTKFQQKVYAAIFKKDTSEATMKSLQTTFFNDVKKGKDLLYEKIVSDGYFEKNPEKERQKYILFAIISFAFANVFLGIVLLIFSYLMPKRTIKGAEKKEEALALKGFLVSQERQLEFQENNWHFFEKLLPYAIAFGVAKVWAKKFSQLQVPQDVSWYQGQDMSMFAVLPFVNSLSAFTKVAETMSGVPYNSSRSSSGFSSGFGGGGFSGGGFGGGGGGSW